MGSMHYRPRPKGYKVKPFIPTKVKISTIIANIESGSYKVIVFYTDEERIVNAPIIKKVEGSEAIPLSIQLLNSWADSDKKVQKYFGPTKRGVLHSDFMGYKNLYGKLHSSQYTPIIALVKID